jgi:hypothetical protein
MARGIAHSADNNVAEDLAEYIGSGMRLQYYVVLWYLLTIVVSHSRAYG